MSAARVGFNPIYFAFTMSSSLALTLAGCAASPPSAHHSAAATPFDVVRQRFFIDAQTPTLDALENLAQSYSRAIDKLQGRKTIAPVEMRRPAIDTSLQMVAWTAYFTDSNFAQLNSPSSALRSHRQSRAGRWTVVEALSADPLVSLRADPMATYLNAYGRVMRHLQGDRATLGFEEVRGFIAADVAAEAAASDRAANQRMNAEFSVKGYTAAQRLESFGLFRCDGDGPTPWFASILPTALLGRNLDNQLDPSGARLAIRIHAPGPSTLGAAQ
jgi:hypothetical protein